jgi:hypothetical protein
MEMPPEQPLYNPRCDSSDRTVTSLTARLMGDPLPGRRELVNANRDPKFHPEHWGKELGIEDWETGRMWYMCYEGKRRMI